MLQTKHVCIVGFMLVLASLWWLNHKREVAEKQRIEETRARELQDRFLRDLHDSHLEDARQRQQQFSEDIQRMNLRRIEDAVRRSSPLR